MLVIIIALSVNLSSKSTELLKSKNTIASLTNTLDNTYSPSATKSKEDPAKTTIAQAQTTIQSEAQAAPAETTAAAETTAPPSDYNIGDTGPAGGLIFYVNPNYQADGWRYLEAAPSDFQGSDNDYRIPWYNGDYVVTGATGTSIGTGMSNTQKIVNIQGSGNYAAKLCDDLTLNGYNDWFMPSKDELNLIYENLYLKGIGSFNSNGCWSSSEIDAVSAWFQYFGNGPQNSSRKYYNDRVRAVRAFY